MNGFVRCFGGDMNRWFKRILALLACYYYAREIRTEFNTYGGNLEEIDSDLPGDFILGDRIRGTRVKTILADAEKVWPWIAQLGRGAGYYSFDYCSNFGHKSADYLVEDLPEPLPGDWNKSLGTLTHVIPGRCLVWVKHKSPFFLSLVDVRNTFLVRQVGEHASRLLIRTTLDWHSIPGMIVAYLSEPFVFFFYRKQLYNIKSLVETYEKRLKNGHTNRHNSGDHQVDSFSFFREDS